MVVFPIIQINLCMYGFLKKVCTIADFWCLCGFLGSKMKIWAENSPFPDSKIQHSIECKYQSNIQRHISLGKDATTFQVEVAAILDCVTSCLRKRLAKEQITICIDSQAAIAALGAGGIKSRFVADCKEKLTAMLEVNQVTTM